MSDLISWSRSVAPRTWFRTAHSIRTSSCCARRRFRPMSASSPSLRFQVGLPHHCCGCKRSHFVFPYVCSARFVVWCSTLTRPVAHSIVLEAFLFVLLLLAILLCTNRLLIVFCSAVTCSVCPRFTHSVLLCCAPFGHLLRSTWLLIVFCSVVTRSFFAQRILSVLGCAAPVDHPLVHPCCS